MYKKILFTFCLFLFCAGLFFGLAQPAFARATTCQFRCPDDSPTVSARGELFSGTAGDEGYACEGLLDILTSHCGYSPGAEVTAILDLCNENGLVVSCECSSSDETFNTERACCMSGGACRTGMGEVEPPSFTPSEPTNAEAIPIHGIDIPRPLGDVSVPELIGRIIKAVLGIVGSIALLMFIYGGFLWLMSGGNEKNITKGKNILVWTSIGLVVIFIAYALVNFVIGSLTGIGGGGASSLVRNRCCCDSGEAEGVSSPAECRATAAVGGEECEWVEVSRCP